MIRTVIAPAIQNGMIRYRCADNAGRPKNEEIGGQGELLEYPKVINPLPPIGSHIILKETVIPTDVYHRNVLFEKYDCDSLGRLIVYKVVSYSEGIDKPLSPKNQMWLEYKIKTFNQVIHQNTLIMTNTIACGYMNWEYHSDTERRKEFLT